ncbi:hypothetical protein BIY37_04745 [Candidatus Brocadia sapporoensis]|uniref:Uncharacterized protein n=1 Tax=Candidatus Brocadia sapporoensis TaxID=392547 RepID=A0A1V6M153_9BACT|nr:hypothetical protein BIY37_04745 [Candidatus Brocadia sapporoensis]
MPQRLPLTCSKTVKKMPCVSRSIKTLRRAYKGFKCVFAVFGFRILNSGGMNDDYKSIKGD